MDTGNRLKASEWKGIGDWMKEGERMKPKKRIKEKKKHRCNRHRQQCGDPQRKGAVGVVGGGQSGGRCRQKETLLGVTGT